MKLLFCRECGDIVKLLGALRYCRCGRAYGRCTNDTTVAITGPAEVIAIDSTELERALRAVTASGPVTVVPLSGPTTFRAWFHYHDYESVQRGAG